MTQTTYRVMTQSAVMPLLSSLSGRTVQIPQYDQTYVPGINPDGSMTPTDKGIAQIYYAHNVMPSTYGYQSIAYRLLFVGNTDHGVYLDSNKLIQATTDGLNAYIAIDTKINKTVLVLQDNGSWGIPNNAPTDLTPLNQVSTATVNGTTYICIAYKGIYTFTKSSNTLNPIELTGLDSTAILGIIAANGYMIAYSTTGANWSATNDPLDFIPSDVTGAGGGNVQELKGPIVWCQATSYGFIIYSTKNAVSVTYTGNSTYPFNFKDLGGSGGLASGDLVSQESTGNQYAYTTNGIQKIFHTGATTFLPYVTDFLAGKIFEDFDESTNKFLVSELTVTMRKKITLISDRYLIISYGISSAAPFTHAIVFDIVQQRMGKLKIVHEHVFEIENLNPEVVETPRDSIGLMNSDGTVWTVDFNTMNLESNGVAVFGKYALIRSRHTQLDAVMIENAEQTANLEVYDLPTYEGKDFITPLAGYMNYKGERNREYLFANVGENHSLLFKGSFNIISLELTVHPHGRL